MAKEASSSLLANERVMTHSDILEDKIKNVATLKIIQKRQKTKKLVKVCLYSS